MAENKTVAAFENYCRDPVVQQALAIANGTLAVTILRDCFMAGAKYAVDRCKAEHHIPRTRNG